jgi:pimeloyl-ACP methyl ester carboxylesterase
MSFRHTEVRVDGATLFCMEAGSGDPLVLVHGGWIDHRSWQFVVPELAGFLHVVAYDRRGHSHSRRAGDGPRSVHEDDLAALITAFGLASAHVAGSSYGASIVLGLAARRPDLVRSVIAHEPPLLGNGVVDGNAELQPMLRAAQAQLQAVACQVRASDTRGGAARFIDEVTLGPGMWDQLPEQLRQTMVDNAPTFLATMDDPRWADLDLQALSRRPVPLLLTDGDHSPAFLRAIVTELARRVGVAGKIQRHTFAGAGHVPQLTHPEQYVETVRAFLATDRQQPAQVPR